MKRDINYYKQLEKLNYYVYHKKQYEKPKGWYKVDYYDDKKTGMYAEAYKNYNG